MKFRAFCLTKECGWQEDYSALDDAREGARHHGVARKDHKARVVAITAVSSFKA